MKRIISLLLTAVILTLGCVSASAIAHKDYPGLDFENDWDNNLKVTGYTGDNPIVSIPESVFSKTVLRIGDSAFSGNTVIEKLIMNDNMTKVKESGLSSCPKLSGVYYSKNLSVIEKYAFAYNSKLNFAFLRGTIVNEIQVGAYYKTAVEYAALPDTMNKLDNMVFENCKIRMINIPDGVVHIGNRCFADCADLQRVYIPASVTFMGKDVFLRANKVTVYTVEGSTAQQYCAENSVNCEIITEDEFPSRMEGDSNGDEKVDIDDATQIQLELLGYRTDFYADNCDYNGDCMLNIDDATEIQLHLAGLK